MNAYEKLLEFSKDRLDDFFSNVKTFDGQFCYNDFNKICYDKMYLNNSQENISSVKDLKNEITDLKTCCKKCGEYYLSPRNKSNMKYDLIMGQVFENIIMEFLNARYNIRAVKGDASNKQYPDCMVLSSDKQIVAYFEVKYHSAPFIYAINKINRYCYEGSITLDYKKIIKQLELIDSDLDRPVFYLHWIDFPCLKGVFFETAEQVKQNIYESGEEFCREKREGDNLKSPQTVYLSKFYSPLLQMGDFEEFIKLITLLEKKGR